MAKKITRWGNWADLEHIPGAYKVKRLVLNHGKSISLQYHDHRAEWWIVVSGVGRCQVEDQLLTITQNDGIYVPIMAHHKLECVSEEPLVIIEVQLGEVCEEADIYRLEEVDDSEEYFVDTSITETSD